MAIYQVITVILAFIGFLIAFNIHHKRRTGEKLVCFIGKDCDTVIHSEYATFLGIPNTILGMAYFILVCATYLTHIVYPALGTPLFILTTLTLTSAAFLFSVYLVFIQAFALREWCE